jgi:hypothetical protein
VSACTRSVRDACPRRTAARSWPSRSCTGTDAVSMSIQSYSCACQPGTQSLVVPTS